MLCSIHALVIWEGGRGLQKNLVVNTDMGGGGGEGGGGVDFFNSEDQPLQAVGTSSPHSSYEFVLRQFLLLILSFYYFRRLF